MSNSFWQASHLPLAKVQDEQSRGQALNSLIELNMKAKASGDHISLVEQIGPA